MIKEISVKELRKYFDDFNNKVVVDKKYKKLNYSEWKNLKHYLEQAEECVEKSSCPENHFITVKKEEEILLSFATTSTLEAELAFKMDDDSFGSYLDSVVFPPYVNVKVNLDGTKISSEDIPCDAKLFDPSTDRIIWNGMPNDKYGVNVDFKLPDTANVYGYKNHCLAQVPVSNSIFVRDEVKPSVIAVKDNLQETKEAVDFLTKSVEKFKNELNPFPDFNKKKEKKNMFNFNFDFGPVDGTKIRMSPYGMAVQNRDNVFVSYDAKNDKIMNVDVFNFDGSKFMYKMPVALSAVQKGDIVVHNRKPMFVTDIDGNRLYVIDVYEGESKAVIPTTNMFGFDFVTKVVSFIDIVGTPNKDNPFGNMLPFLMMNEDGDNDNFLMAMAISQMDAEGNMFQNPMFLMAMMKDDKDNFSSKNDMFKMMMLSQMFSKMNASPSPVSTLEQMSFMPDSQK